jgi:hypothetical protein
MGEGNGGILMVGWKVRLRQGQAYRSLHRGVGIIKAVYLNTKEYLVEFNHGQLGWYKENQLEWVSS